MVDHLFNKAEKDRSIGVAYFYFDYQISVSPRDIIASLLKQLCLQKDKDAIPPSIAQLWRSRKDQAPHDSQESLTSDGAPKGPEFGELLAAFLTVATKFRRTYVCIDALDECSEEHQHARDEILHRLRQSRCFLLVTSRRDIKCSEDFSNVPQISITATPDDIEHYVTSVLKQHPELHDMVDNGLQRRISGVLADKSNGM
jgi:hypothetical protein